MVVGAEEVVVAAPNGGVGEVGALGEPGGDGGDGSDAVAEASGDADNLAEARAGQGGNGGRGGASPEIGVSGGAGGAGGDGGDAEASAATVGDASAMSTTAIAFGGDGGMGAYAGSEFAGAPTQATGSGGHGGSAQSTGHLVSTAVDVVSGSLDAYVRASGGDGGRSPSIIGSTAEGQVGGNGGDATSRLTLVANGEDVDADASASGGEGGDGDPSAAHGNGGDGSSYVSIEQHGQRGSIDFRGGAHGGAAGSFGAAGSASSAIDVLSHSTEGSDVYNSASVGDGSSTYDGGSATSTATAVNTSSGFLDVEVMASAGSGRFGGEASATAQAEALGASARVTATQIHGASLGHDELGHGLSGRPGLMTDAVTGRAIYLELTQAARAGWGGAAAREGGNGGAGGEARTSLHRVGMGDRGIELRTTSTAGQGGTGFGSGHRGGRGGDAWVEGVVEEAAGPVAVYATATAGRGGGGMLGAEPGEGGDVSFGRVFGSSSDGSSVSVGAFATAGHGGEIRGFYDSMGTVGGDGRDVRMVDLVDGRTSGAIALGQQVLAGSGGSGDLAGGDGGTAFNSITRTFDNESVAVTVSAAGGDGGAARTGPDGDGGEALSTLRVVSTGGDLELGAYAQAGDGRTSGEARVDAYGRTEGDGHSIEFIPFLSKVDGGRSAYGGDAYGRFVGEATGNSRVSVVGSVVGGDGDVDGLVASDGHDAFSYAEGSNAGDADVEVVAYARGGDGGDTDRQEEGPSGGGGNAEATAWGRSTGGGRVTVRARQTAGRAGESVYGGNGLAASSMMVDAVRGSTSGRLTLEQMSIGGDAYRDVTGGDAYSSLRAENPGGGALEATSEAVGGEGGGGATADVTATDHHGAETIARALATGGDGGLNGQAGAAATASAKGISTAGADVRVVATASGGTGYGLAAGGDVDLLNAVSGSTAGVLTLEQNAIGGLSGRPSYVEVGPRGGDARSSVEASNLGGGDLRLHSLAQGGEADGGTGSGGGTGGSAESSAVGHGAGSGITFVSDVARGGASVAAGGRATSRAEGRATGSSGVEVRSAAIGGASTFPDGYAGDADSTAMGVAAQGPALVFASASGGAHYRDDTFHHGTAGPERHTTARASATAVGVGSSAESLAEGRAGFIGDAEHLVSAMAHASGDGHLSSEASAGLDARSALDSLAQSAAAIDGVHQRDGEWTRIGLQLNSEEEGPDIILRAEGRLWTDSRRRSLEGLHLSFLDYRQNGAEFSDLRFMIEDRSELVLDRTFSSPEDAQSFFQSTLDLGMLPDIESYQSLRLRFILEGSGGAGAGRIGTYFSIGTVVVPEPGTANLILLGLIWLASGRHTTRQQRPC